MNSILPKINRCSDNKNRIKLYPECPDITNVLKGVVIKENTNSKHTRNFLLFILLILIPGKIIAQKELLNGYIVLESNDTIFGQLRDKPYYSKDRVRLYNGENKIVFKKKAIKEFAVDGDLYVKSFRDIWFRAFFRKEIAGPVNVYSYKRRKYLGMYDTDLNLGALRPSLRLYCDDFSGLSDSISHANRSNIDDFVKEYNDWKTMNPDSRSYFEANMHTRKFINLKFSFLLPGAGFEFGLSDHLAHSILLKNEFGYIGSYGWVINPFIDNQLRYYYNMDKRIDNHQRTYKYSGNYLCLNHAYFFKGRSNMLGFQYGWQRTYNKNSYFNLGLGLGKWLGHDVYAILYDLDFGFDF